MNRNIALDFLRLIAAYLVLVGHYVWGGTFGTDGVIKYWASHNEVLPLLDSERQQAWKIDAFLMQDLNTAFAIVGVALFFVISGWLVPSMLVRYSRRDFILNRLFRIFPMLIFAVFVAAFIQYFYGERSTLDLFNVISTATLSANLLNFPTSLPVVWTLIIEFKLYILLAIIGPLNHKKLFGLIGLILFISISYTFIHNSGILQNNKQVINFFSVLLHDFSYMLFMFIGSILWMLNEEKSDLSKKKMNIVFVILVLFFFNFNHYLINVYGEINFYQDFKPTTQAIVLFIFILAIRATKLGFYDGAFGKYIESLSTVTYSLYLLHVSVGFFLLSELRHMINNQYILLLFITLIVTLLSSLTYRFIEVPCNKFFKSSYKKFDVKI